MRKAVLFLTYRCNDYCRFCIEPDKIKDRDIDISFALPKLTKILPDLDMLVISGGEPFLSEAWKTILDALDTSCFSGELIIETNCTLLTQDNLDKIRNVVGDHLMIMASLHGFEQTHDYLIQRTGSFHERIQGMKLIRDNYIKLKTNTVVLPENADELPDFYDFLSDTISPDIIQISSLDMIGKSMQSYGSYMPFESFKETLKRVMDRIEQRQGQICFEKIPLCTISETYRKYVYYDGFNDDKIVFLMPKSICSISHDRRYKFENCKECKITNKCEGIYPSVDKNWFIPRPI